MNKGSLGHQQCQARVKALAGLAHLMKLMRTICMFQRISYRHSPPKPQALQQFAARRAQALSIEVLGVLNRRAPMSKETLFFHNMSASKQPQFLDFALPPGIPS
jgi:hypothetical protein